MVRQPGSPQRELAIEYLPIKSLQPDPQNARKHDKRQIDKLAAAMREFGVTNPILIDEDCLIIAGHARVLAAAEVPLTHVPTIRLRGLTTASRKALAIADNKLGDMSQFDIEALTTTLLELDELAFNIELTGFDTAELDIMLDVSNLTEAAAASDEDLVPEVGANAASVSAAGDVWELGEHRLLCGNALEEASFDTLLGIEQADLIFVDCPYNVKINGHVSGLGKVKHREFAMASGEMSSPQFVEFLTTAMTLMTRYSRDGSIHYHCMDFRHMREILEAGEIAYTELKNLCVWDKGSGGMGSLYRSQHELIFVFKNGTGSHVNNVQLGRFGRTRTNVWQYPGMNSFGRGRNELLAAHSTVKPTSLVADAIRDCSNRGDLVLDPFVGSGTTIIAAERTGRRAAAIEIDPQYVDVAVRRWQTYTGRTATLRGDGRMFAEVAAARIASDVLSSDEEPTDD